MIESLEQRRMLSYTVEDDGLGNLYLTGTGGADYFQIQLDDNDGTAWVNDGREWATFPGIYRVSVDCGLGNDYVDASLLVISPEAGRSIVIDGGPGDDDLHLDGPGSIYAGSGDDFLYGNNNGTGAIFDGGDGDQGDDEFTLEGDTLDATIYARAGNDMIDVSGVGNGSTRVYAGDGNDTIIGSDFRDYTVDGGAGVDDFWEHGGVSYPTNVENVFNNWPI